MPADLCATSHARTAGGTRSQQLAATLRRFLPALTLAASRGGAVLVQFSAQLVVATMAGAAGLGTLQLFTSWTCLAGEVCGRGLPTLSMRTVSVAFADGRGEMIERSLRDSRRRILRAWTVLALLATAAAALLSLADAASAWTSRGWLLIAAGLAAPLFSLVRLHAESLKATGAVLPAVTLENLTSPLALLLVCAACWLAGQAVVSLTLVIAFALGLAITACMLNGALREQIAQLPRAISKETGAETNRPAAAGELLSLWATSILSVGFVHLPFVVMPLYVDTAEIGVFAVAHKLINVITTLLLLLAAIFGPAFARRAARQDRPGMLALMQRTQLISTAVFLPASLLMVAIAEPLARLFGEDFGQLQTYLAILALGHLINAATGLSGVLLNMAGAASKELSTLIIALAAALAGSAWVGPEHGAFGLALVFSGSIALKNIASYALARRLLTSTGEHP